MHIKEIQLEGFKSYAQKTVISQFDSQFNAITGLNGSGKSNILDAILFVLGLSQYSIARVDKLQDLIYKQGQAGITKASVCIIFDNSNKQMSPSGYEQFSEIIVTRQIQNDKSKYFVNGNNENPKKIKNLFRSIQLNIENPHFLVAQGKITKIINLKASDLVGMLEETAGTSLYMDKKLEAQKLMKRKQEKIDTMQKLMEEEIEPNIVKIQKERGLQREFKEVKSQIKDLERQIIQYRYNDLKNKNEEVDKKQQNLKQNILTDKNNLTRINNEIAHDQQLIQQLKSDQNDDQNRQNLQKAYDDQKILLSKLEEKINLDRDQQEQLEKKYNKNNNVLENFQNQQPTLQLRIEKLENYKQELIQQKGYYNQQIYEFKQAQEAINNGGKSNTQNYEELLQQAKNQKIHNEQQQQQLLKNILELENQYNQISQQEQEQSSQRQKIQKQIQELKREIDELNDKVNSIQINEEQLIILKEEQKQLENQISQLEQEKQSEENRNQFLKLNFQNPSDNFDRRKVIGRVITQFRVKNKDFSLAIEQAAGGRLMNIIVDNEETGTLLVHKNSFRQYVNIIPLNKIKGQMMSEQVLKQNQEIAKKMNGQADLALNMIEYESGLENAMKFVFGNVMIVSSSQIGQAIANQQEQQYRRKCVTQEGDVYETTGALQGGYQNHKQSAIKVYYTYTQIIQQIQQSYHQRGVKQQTLSTFQQNHIVRQQINNQIKEKKNKLDYLKQDLINYQTNNLLQNKNNILENKTHNEEQLSNLKKKQLKIFDDINNYHEIIQDKSENNQASIISKNLNKLQNDFNDLENELIQVNLKLQNNKSDIDVQQSQIEELIKEKNNLQIKIQEDNQNILHNQQKFQTEKQKLIDRNQELKKYLAENAIVQTKLNEKNDKIQKLINKKDELEKNLKDNQQKQDTYQKQFEKLQKELEEIRNQNEIICHLEEQDQYLDMNNFDYETNSEKLQQLKNRYEYLRKNINFKQENLNDKLENEIAENKKKYEQLQIDKDRLNIDIEELDSKRRKSLRKCYEEVSKSMQEIFSTLLKGAQVRLLAVDNGQIEDGLQIHVGFGKKWITTLSELSGGQRSLLALSFLLSLLKYKPCPFYILDEIDAALDNSHTENIGSMIQKYFPQSQFIIISLKEGMFNHANTLFKTSFNDGISKVDRYNFKSKQKANIKMES